MLKICLLLWKVNVSLARVAMLFLVDFQSYYRPSNCYANCNEQLE